MATAALRACGAMTGGGGQANGSRRPSSAGPEGSGASREWLDKDFYGQMDESGIIGLNQAAEGASLEVGGAKEAEGDTFFYQDPLQEQSFHLSELQDSLSPGGGSHALSLCDLDEQASDSQAGEEDGGGWLFRRLRDMSGDEEAEREDPSSPEEFPNSHFWGAEAPDPRQAGERDVGGVGPCHGDGSGEETVAVQVGRDSPGERCEGSSLRNTVPPWCSGPPSSPTGEPKHFLACSNHSPVRLRLTDSPGFESDALTEARSLLETQEEMCHCQQDLEPRGGISSNSEWQESQDRRGLTPASCSPQLGWVPAPGSGQAEAEDREVKGRPEESCFSQCTSLLPWLHRASQNLPSSASQYTPEACQPSSNLASSLRGPRGPKTSTVGYPKRGCSQGNRWYCKGRLNHPLPDLSKVEPRVNFPKGGYKPPKSKGRPRKKGLASEKPLVFKSPAEIVREVLLSSAEAPPLPPALPTPGGAPRPLNATVPLEFRSPQQASTLVHQLQEDYNRLLTKYAEAENTIDRLRLEAKVNLYSDPPKPRCPDFTGTIQLGSKVMTLTLPQAQRAEQDQTAVSTGADPESAVEAGCSPTVPCTSAYSSTRSLDPRLGERLTEVLSRQAGRFQMQVDSFEELLRTGKLEPFEEVLKGLSCLAQGQGSLERGYLRAREEHRLQQQQGGDPGPFDPHREVEGEIFRMGVRLEDLKEQVQTGEQVRLGSSAPPGTNLTMDPVTASAPCSHLQSQPSSTAGGARELLGVSLASEATEGAAEMDTRQPSPHPWAQSHRYQRGQNSLLRLLQQASEGETESCLSPSPGHCHPEPLPLCPAFPWQRSRDQTWNGAKSGSSSPASAAGSVASENRASEPQSSLRRAPLQGGVVSPEADSGFLGSQSSHLNLAAPSPAQQEAIVSLSSPLEGGGVNMLPISTQPRLGPACQGLTQTDCSRAVASDPEDVPIGDKSRLAPPGSPRHLSGISSTHSSSEGDEESRSVLHNHLANQRPRHEKRPSLTSLHRHGNPSRVQGSGQLAERHTAIQSLQDEMSRLRERLEGSLRKGKSSSTATAPPVVQEASLHSHSSYARYLRFSESQEDERREEEEQEGEMESEEEEVERAGEVPCTRCSPVPPLRPELTVTSDSQRCQTTSNPQSYGTRIPESTGAHKLRKREEGAKPVEQRRPHTEHQNSMAASRVPDEVSWSKRQSHMRSDHTQNDRIIAPPRVGPAGGVATSPQTRPCSGFPPPCQGSSRCQNRPDPGLSTHSTSGPTHQNTRPMGFTHSRDGGVFLTAPPPNVQGSMPLVQYVPLSPFMLYYSSPTSGAPPNYPQPLVLDGRGARARGGRARGGGAGRHAHALSVDRSLSDSLTRAIEAARRMKATSRHMARSLSAGLHHQGALSLSGCAHR